MADRLYDEKEVGAILQRASEIQAGLTPQGANEGLTLTDLQKVAAEVGIEASVMEQAANEVQSTTPIRDTRARANAVRLDRTVTGVVTEECWDEVVTRLRSYVGNPGQNKVSGRTFEWWYGWDTGNLMVSASTKNGKTRFKLMGETTGGAVLAWTLGLTFGVLISLITGALVSKGSHNGLLAVAIALSIMGGALLATTLILKSWRKRSHAGMAQVFEDVVSMVDRSPGAVAFEPTSVVSEPEIETLFQS